MPWHGGQAARHPLRRAVGCAQLLLSLLPDADQLELQQARRQVHARLPQPGQRASAASVPQVRRLRLGVGARAAARRGLRLRLASPRRAGADTTAFNICCPYKLRPRLLAERSKF